MLRLRDIMTADVVTVAPELSIRDAMALFAKRHVSGAPVVASGTVVGVISTTDLMEFAASLPGVAAERPESNTEDDWTRVDEEVPDEDVPMAYFAEGWNDAGADVSERVSEVSGSSRNALEDHTVEEAMTRNLFALAPDTAVELAADRMRSAGVHRVLVMQDKALLGIVTTKDISDAVADHKVTAHRFVSSPRDELDTHGQR
jgi:CBS domain-containing protein